MKNNATQNQSSLKAFEIMEYMSTSSNKPKKLQDIAAALNMNVSTTLRYITSMCTSGYAKQDKDTLQYSLTMKICGIANRVTENMELSEIVKPFLREVSSYFNESSCVSVSENMQVVYIAVNRNNDYMIRTNQKVGKFSPMHCTGSGKLLLTEQDETYIDEMIQRYGLNKFTEHTITDKQELIKEIERVRNEKIAYDNEEIEMGAMCIAVPIYNYTGHIIAAMSVTGPKFRMEGKIKDKKNVEYLKKMADEISRLLGMPDTDIKDE